MKPVDQSIYNAERGDCLRAAWASVLDLDIEAVPHFILHNNNVWYEVFLNFLEALGWEHQGEAQGCPEECFTINGYTVGTVLSQDFPGCLHAVVVDCNGVVVHDPGPNKNWQDKNLLKDNDLISYDKVQPLR